MSKIQVLVVEDNELEAQAVSIALTKHSMNSIVCSSGEEAIEIFKGKHVDLVLMDIVLSGKMDGITSAQKILQERPAPIIYLTDHTDKKMFSRAIKTHPSNYLSKPFHELNLIQAITLAFENFQMERPKRTDSDDNTFVFTENQQFMRVSLKDLLYLEASRSYCKVVTDTATYTLCSNMDKVHKMFNHDDLIRVQRSYVVNTKRITRLDGNVIYLDTVKIDMGRKFRDGLLNALKLIR